MNDFCQTNTRTVLRIRNDLFRIRIRICSVLDPDPDPDPTHIRYLGIFGKTYYQKEEST